VTPVTGEHPPFRPAAWQPWTRRAAWYRAASCGSSSGLPGSSPRPPVVQRRAAWPTGTGRW